MVSTAEETDNDSLLDTDSDMALEDQIETHEESVAEFALKTSSFKVGTQNHNMNEQTAIFECSGINKQMKQD